MKGWKRHLAQIIALGSVLALIYSIAPARDREFNAIAGYLATKYASQREEVPWPGVVNAVFRVTRPAGLRRLKFVRFTDPMAIDSDGALSLGETLVSALGPEWRLLLRQHSRRTARQTHIYAKSAGEAQRLLLVRVEAGAATLLEATLDPRDFAMYLEQPDKIDVEIEDEPERK
jgi:hypothetical protein